MAFLAIPPVTRYLYNPFVTQGKQRAKINGKIPHGDDRGKTEVPG